MAVEDKQGTERDGRGRRGRRRGAARDGRGRRRRRRRSARLARAVVAPAHHSDPERSPLVHSVGRRFCVVDRSRLEAFPILVRARARDDLDAIASVASELEVEAGRELDGRGRFRARALRRSSSGTADVSRDGEVLRVARAGGHLRRGRRARLGPADRDSRRDLADDADRDLQARRVGARAALARGGRAACAGSSPTGWPLRPRRTPARRRARRRRPSAPRASPASTRGSRPSAPGRGGTSPTGRASSRPGNAATSSMLEWPQPTRLPYSSGVYCASWKSRSAPVGELGAGVGREPELVVGDVGERASCFLDPVAERRSRDGSRAPEVMVSPSSCHVSSPSSTNSIFDGSSSKRRGKNGGDR